VKGKKSLFVLGDSISIHYGPFLRTMLRDIFDYDRKGRGKENSEAEAEEVNGGDSAMVLEYLQRHIRRISRCDVLLLNCGLHDIKTDNRTGVTQVPLARYEQNLSAVLNLIEPQHVRLAWVSTTPVEDHRHNRLNREFKRYNRDVIAYNRVASGLMNARNVPVIDLYTFMCNLDLDLYCDHVHFTEKVRALQASYIAGALCFL